MGINRDCLARMTTYATGLDWKLNDGFSLTGTQFADVQVLLEERSLGDSSDEDRGFALLASVFIGAFVVRFFQFVHLRHFLVYPACTYPSG
jgi:hypothetical protein